VRANSGIGGNALQSAFVVGSYRITEATQTLAVQARRAETSAAGVEGPGLHISAQERPERPSLAIVRKATSGRCEFAGSLIDWGCYLPKI
jgi:hypothetical protein